jgi:hypothetical protein
MRHNTIRTFAYARRSQNGWMIATPPRGQNPTQPPAWTDCSVYEIPPSALKSGAAPSGTRQPRTGVTAAHRSSITTDQPVPTASRVAPGGDRTITVCTRTRRGRHGPGCARAPGRATGSDTSEARAPQRDPERAFRRSPARSLGVGRARFAPGARTEPNRRRVRAC